MRYEIERHKNYSDLFGTSINMRVASVLYVRSRPTNGSIGGSCYLQINLGLGYLSRFRSFNWREQLAGIVADTEVDVA